MIRVLVLDEQGNEISEGLSVPPALLARPDDPRFSCLRFVDPYGDTIFNRLQLPSLLGDLQLVRESIDDTQNEKTLSRVESLIERCQAEPHLYLKLIGD
ncbi:MAG: hypothetical protein ABFC63_09240 [Thermoguttaceae bacterium]